MEISETDFFDALTIQNDQISYVKHVSAPLYVFFTLFGCWGGRGLPRGLGHNLLMQFSRLSSSRMVVPLRSSRCLAEGNRISFVWCQPPPPSTGGPHCAFWGNCSKGEGTELPTHVSPDTFTGPVPPPARSQCLFFPPSTTTPPNLDLQMAVRRDFPSAVAPFPPHVPPMSNANLNVSWGDAPAAQTMLAKSGVQSPAAERLTKMKASLGTLHQSIRTDVESRKAQEEARINEVRELATKVDKHLQLEVKRRTDADKTLQHMFETRLKDIADNIEKGYAAKLDDMRQNVDILTKKVAVQGHGQATA